MRAASFTRKLAPVALLAAALLFTSVPVQAQRGGGGHGGNGGGGRAWARGGNGGGARPYGGGFRTTPPGGFRGGRGFDFRGAPRAYGGGFRTVPRVGGTVYGGGFRTWRGPRIVTRYHFYAPYYRFHHRYPRSYFRLGIGVPYGYYSYYPYPYYDYDDDDYGGYPVSVDVTNYPPAGCYYYDPYDDRTFTDLDDYTEFLDRAGPDHPATIDVVVAATGDRLRTLEFVGGHWQIER